MLAVLRDRKSAAILVMAFVATLHSLLNDHRSEPRSTGETPVPQKAGNVACGVPPMLAVLDDRKSVVILVMAFVAALHSLLNDHCSELQSKVD